jgi:hypothetical protein
MRPPCGNRVDFWRKGLAMDMYVGETAAGSQGEIVPFEDAVLLQAKLVKRSSLKIYPAYPHGCLL